MDTLEDFWNGIKSDGIRDIAPGYVGGAVVLLIVAWLIALIVSKVVGVIPPFPERWPSSMALLLR